MMPRLKQAAVVFLILWFRYKCGICKSQKEEPMKQPQKAERNTKEISLNAVAHRTKQYLDMYKTFKISERNIQNSFIKAQSSYVTNHKQTSVERKTQISKENIRIKRFILTNNSDTSNTTAVPALDYVEYDAIEHQNRSDSEFNFQEVYNGSVPPPPDYETDFLPLYVMTLEDSEKHLQREDTQDFLNTFSDEFQRNIVKTHLLYCPHTPLCNFSLDVYFDKTNFQPPCAICSCENCESTDTCCPDIIDFSDRSTSDLLTQTDCLYLSLKKSDNTFETVSKCYARVAEHSSEADICSDDINHQTFSDILPVTDTTTNVTYKNRNCAICNNVPVENLVVWQSKLTCTESGDKPHTYTTENEFIQFVLESDGCNLIYSLSAKGIGKQFCYQTIDTCNVTGNWYIFDPFIMSACQLYKNQYKIVKDPYYEATTYRYRNIFCALCNGESPESVLLSQFHHFPIDGGSYDFSGLLKFHSTSEIITDTGSPCDSGFVYDRIKEDCTELRCPPIRTLINNICDPIFSELNNIIYKLTLRLYPLDGWKAVLNDLVMVHEETKRELEAKLQAHLARINIFPPFPDYGMIFIDIGGSFPSFICSINFFTSGVDKNPANESDFQNVEQYFEIEFQFYIKDWHSLEDILQLSAELVNETLEIPIHGNVHSFEIQIRDFWWRNRSLANSVRAENSCSNTTGVINLSMQKSCPLVSVPIANYDCIENKNGIACPSINISLNVSEYYFSANGSTIFICSDVYLNQIIGNEVKKQSSSSVSIILSLVCTVISLLCLVLSFLTFCLFPRLRTLPGKNNMALILALIFAQSMFLISSFGRIEVGSFACKFVGVLTHFCWLSAIFWMNICTFHVFRVFTGIEALSVESESKSFLVYTVYTFVFSIVLVITNILASLFSSNMTEFGYGKTICYISREKMVEFTFGIPVGFVIITNLIMFLFFVVKIKTAPVVKKDVKNERNDIVIFAKLSTLTGFTWIFGFIYSWTEVEMFSFFFIVLNATQGIFLFLSFVCNKRVFSMYRNRSFGVTSTSEAYRTRVTDSQKSTVKHA